MRPTTEPLSWRVPYLLDTNILIRLVHRTDSNHALARAALRKLKLSGETGHYAQS